MVIDGDLLAHLGHASAVPFTYRQGQGAYHAHERDPEMAVNQAIRRRPKAHVTIKYLEPDFAELFLRAFAGLGPDGSQDTSYRGRDTGRNVAMATLALSTGLRRQ